MFTKNSGAWRRLVVCALLLVVAVIGLFIGSGSALAYETRLVNSSTLIVGFLNEPVYAGVENGIDLTICDGAKCKYELRNFVEYVLNPVVGAEQTLKADVSIGGNAPLPIPLTAIPDKPGKYAGYFVPAQAGPYTFHIYGTLKETAIDEKFTSGPQTFGAAQLLPVYPADGNSRVIITPVPAPAPTAAEPTEPAASTATLSIIGLALGALALVVAVVALLRRPIARDSRG